ncbi:hypothetical protein HGRIS_012481 [Hohenbuehelia grisea]|uniref:Phosphatidate phosphatase APP1 catalytic domain-containing protein n=1 Tax=Hohenbuehelia grisea TaxID=104357 RepID=A0ABR3ISF9_9AGAR
MPSIHLSPARAAAIIAAALIPGGLALPTNDQNLDARGFFNFFPELGRMNDVLLFDGLGFQDPQQNDTLRGNVQAFAHLRQLPIGPLIRGVSGFIKDEFDLVVGDNVGRVEERLRLFAAVGSSEKNVNIKVQGCSAAQSDWGTHLGVTDERPHSGQILSTFKLGDCGKKDGELTGRIEIVSDGFFGSGSVRKFENTIFVSPPDGFGIISDIDDTVKITGTLDKKKLVQTTLLDDPEPVPGMPEVYASLKKSLTTSAPPAFVYVSGSPFELYPFLRSFIHDKYSESKGPILLQNFTITDIPSVIDFAKSAGIKEYKSSMIERVQGFYPQKKFLMVGDSTQKDPETYGDAFRKFGGDFVACIWIRKVEGADNSDQRFETAFKDVPKERIRVYEDKDISSLSSVDVKGGKCQ